MGRMWSGVVILLVAVGVAVAVAAASRGGDKAPKPARAPAASQRYDEDPNLMRPLERKKLVTGTR